ncbi:MAG: DUF4249 family protein [Bacteroidota bacterium]
MRIFFFLLFGLLLCSCLDQIKLEVPEGLEEGIVITGALQKSDPSFIKIEVSNIFNFDLKTLAPTRAKSVFLMDDAGNELEIPITGNGINRYIFKGDETLKVEFGRQYKIRVTDQKDRVFESTLEELMPPVEKGALSYEFSEFEFLDEENEVENLSAVQFGLNSSIKLDGREENARIVWFPERTYALSDSLFIPDFVAKTCYITAPIKITTVELFDGSDLGLEQLENHPLSKVPINYEFAEGYYYTLYQRTLNKEAFDYWKQTKQVIERTGNQFEPPVGRIISNFRNINDESDGNVFGYFSAFYEDTLQLCVTPEEVGSPSRLCPVQDVLGCPVPNPCCDCLLEGFSQLEKPDFWEK